MNWLYLILGGLGGGVIGFLVRWIKDAFKIKELENKLLIAEKEKDTMKTLWQEEKQKALKFQSLLSDALASMELLKAYKAIDDVTKKKIKELKDTFKDGKATEETHDKYKQIIDEINKRNKEYNEGKSKEEDEN